MAARIDHRLFLILVLFFSVHVNAQPEIDSFNFSSKEVKQYSQKVLNKMNLYETRLAKKTEKTLAKLSTLENKIRNILKKVSPQSETKLFGNNQLTFSSLLIQLKTGEQLINKTQASYNSYLDTLTTSLSYLEKFNPEEIGNSAVQEAAHKLTGLKDQLSITEFTEQFIRQRKALLVKEAGKYVKQKLLTKISKENYYYAQALINYKELFSDKSKTEELVKRAITEIPAFQKFMQQNSQLASLFSIPGNGAGGSSALDLSGLQTRASVQNLVQQRIDAGGPNAASQMQQNLAEAQSKLTALKDKLLKGGVIGSGGEVEMPDFNPNSQRSKTLWQRLEYGFDVQFAKNNSWMPSTSDIAASLGYKLNDKSIAGIGISYKLGLGSIEHIRLTSEGIGLRSYLDWKIKGSIYATGGYEMNYNSSFKRIGQLQQFDAWQRSALMGFSKKYKISKKMKGEIKVLYDFMANSHVPVSAPFVFRVGYKL